MIDIQTIIATLAPTILSLGLTGWVYKILNHIIKDLKEQISKLEVKVKELEDSENKWYRKYHELKVVTRLYKCKDRECPVNCAMDEMLSKTGEA